MGIEWAKLKEPMPFKWKVQTANDRNCQCVAYVDARQVQDKLDDVVGPANWKADYFVVNNELFCTVSIWDDDRQHWVGKTDCGTESMTEKEKGQASDAFKRACVHWGIGRFLYSLEIQSIKSMKDSRGKNVPMDETTGKQIWDVTKYITDKLAKGSNNSKASSAVKQAQVNASAPKSTPVSTTTTQSSDGHTPTAGRYNADKGGDKAVYNTTASYSADTIAKVKSLSRDGLTGKDVLKKYIPAYNEANKTEYASVSDFKTDELVGSLISFIENTPPAGF